HVSAAVRHVLTDGGGVGLTWRRRLRVNRGVCPYFYLCSAGQHLRQRKVAHDHHGRDRKKTIRRNSHLQLLGKCLLHLDSWELSQVFPIAATPTGHSRLPDAPPHSLSIM